MSTPLRVLRGASEKSRQYINEEMPLQRLAELRVEPLTGDTTAENICNEESLLLKFS